MFDKIFELISAVWQSLLPFTVVHQYNKALILRFGKVHRHIEPGFHFMWPLKIEEVMRLSSAWRIAELQAQALVSRDGKPVIAGIVVTYRVHDLEKALLEINDVFIAAQDSCQATFAEHVLSTDYDELRTEEFSAALLKECRVQGFKYGIEIAKVRLHELSPARTVRLVGNGEVSH